MNFVMLDVPLDSFPPLLLVALRFLLVAFPAVFFLARPAVAARSAELTGAAIVLAGLAVTTRAMVARMPQAVAAPATASTG